MTDYCPYCGTKLGKTSWGRKHCPNHGIIEESESEEAEKSESEEGRSYIG